MKKAIKLNQTQRGYLFLRVFRRFHVAWNVFGNCFSGICFEPSFDAPSWTDKKGVVRHCTRFRIVLRWNQVETDIHWRGWFRFDWNSGHLARKFGVWQEAPHGDVYTWKFLGTQHVDL
tara:strand:- start:291 stop:644 length:354 start_codon:yes stop_codon:yes gene_type:complete